MSFLLKAENISKKYSRQVLFKDINLEISAGTVLSITGRNGSGKSTLLQILSTLISPGSGNVTFHYNEQKEEVKKYSAFVSPYVNLYEELSIDEHIEFISKVRSIDIDKNYLAELVDAFQLSGNQKIVKQYSSGMKQKLKYILAFISKPKVLFLDEPFTNLDSSGINFINLYIEKNAYKTAFVIASNDQAEQVFSNQNLKLL